VSTLRWSALLALVDGGVWALAYGLVAHGWLLGAGLLAYAALSLLAVIVLYLYAAAGHNPGPYLKGARAPWLQPLFLPFRAVAWLVTLSARLWRWRSPAISEIAPGLYLGVRLFLPEAVRLEQLGVRCVLDLCAELPTNVRLTRAPFERLQVPVLDRCAPVPDEVERAAEWVAAQRAAGHAVYIHCAFGRGRSAMVAAAVLLRLGLARSADEAIEQLVRARRVVSIKGAQYRALERYARTLTPPAE
jgi:protein-tyrosine phosphatase